MMPELSLTVTGAPMISLKKAEGSVVDPEPFSIAQVAKGNSVLDVVS